MTFQNTKITKSTNFEIIVEDQKVGARHQILLSRCDLTPAARKSLDLCTGLKGFPYKFLPWR